MSEDKILSGTPSPPFLPARNTKWTNIAGPVVISVPLTGDFADYGDFGEAGSFEVVSSVGMDDYSYVFSMGMLMKVFFAAKKYPKLEDNQIFSISSIAITKDEKEVHVVGNILERLTE